MKKCVNTCDDDEPCQKPSYCGTAFLCGRVKFHRHPEKSCNRFPPFVRWRAIEIRAARLLGELLNFRQCNRLARFLRQDNLRFCFRQRPRLERLCFAGIEPDEFANSTDFDLDSAAAVEGDLKHPVSAGWTGTGASSFVVDRVQPKWVDRFRRESATQQLQTNRAAIAFFATPDDAVAGTQFRQWNSTSRTKKFSVHAGMRSQTRRAVDRAAGGRALRDFCRGGCRGARDTRATTEMPEMATTHHRFEHCTASISFS